MTHRVNIHSANRNNLGNVGLVKCELTSGEIMFDDDFIVCKNLTKPAIIGVSIQIYIVLAVPELPIAICTSILKSQSSSFQFKLLIAS